MSSFAGNFEDKDSMNFSRIYHCAVHYTSIEISKVGQMFFVIVRLI
jgi:hypothetical protein